MTVGKKGMGTAKHRKSGHTTKSPKMRAHMKREAERDERKDHSRLKDPKTSTNELFHKR